MFSPTRYGPEADSSLGGEPYAYPQPSFQPPYPPAWRAFPPPRLRNADYSSRASSPRLLPRIFAVNRRGVPARPVRSIVLPRGIWDLATVRNFTRVASCQTRSLNLFGPWRRRPKHRTLIGEAGLSTTSQRSNRELGIEHHNISCHDGAA